MRIRSIKPEFWRSDDIGRLSWEDRLLFIGLWSYVDDNGVGRDEEALIIGDLFPLDMCRDTTETLGKVSGGLRRLSEAGLIDRYDAEERRFLHISTWDRHQRIHNANKPRYPLPTSGNTHPRETQPTPSVDPPETLRPGTEEQRNRGTEEKDPSSEVADAPIRPEIEHLLDYLDAAIASNGAKLPTRTKKNTDAARLLIDKDGHTIDDVKRAIDWATTDEFWRSNILSMSKLREKYDTLRMAATRQRTQSQPRQSTSDKVRGWAELSMQYAQDEQKEIGQ